MCPKNKGELKVSDAGVLITTRGIPEYLTGLVALTTVTPAFFLPIFSFPAWLLLRKHPNKTWEGGHKS